MTTKKVELTAEQVVSKEQEVKKLMSMYQITRPEAEVQRAMYDLWYKHYTNDSLTIKERIAMTRTFKNEYADPGKIKLDKAFLRHPATRLKDYSRSCTIGEILGDFVMRIVQVEEREAEYPVLRAIP